MTRRPLVAGLLLLAAYLALSAFQDPHGYLGTDTGAKVATLEHMVDTGSWEPGLPYWAEDLDPEGRVHPIYDTRRVDGEWVHVTTLPMLLAARPLYALGGYRLTLLLPMLGAVGVAFAVRAIAVQVAGPEAGWRAFWLAGLASPVVVYALDLWEHALGVAAVVGAVALLAKVVDGSRSPWVPLGAGALLGGAATMRTEALVYALVAVGACGLLLLQRREARRAVAVGVLALAGFAPVWLANRALEVAVGGGSRSARASGAASRGLSDVGDRVREAAITLIGARPDTLATMLAVGGTLVGLVAGAVLLARAGRGDLARALLVAAGALHLVLVVDGLGFLSGMLVAAPLAVVALTCRPGSRSGDYVLVVAVGALPLVWAFQYLGGALPQWGGRYSLPSCLLLVALGAVALPRLGRGIRLGVVALAVLVSASGVAWLAERSHGVHRWFEAAAAEPDHVLIARNGFFVREGGPISGERRWLTAVTADDLERAVEVVGEAGLRTFATIDEDPSAPSTLGSARLTGTDRTELLGVPLYLHHYELPANMRSSVGSDR